MPGLYIGSTSGYSGKNMIVAGFGLHLQKEGVNLGYMKPVGAVPIEIDGQLWDEDAFFLQGLLGVSNPPDAVTPVIVTHDFKVQAFNGRSGNYVEPIVSAYEKINSGKDLTLVAGSGSMYSGKYCGVDGVHLVKTLGIKCVVIDRFKKELNYDYLLFLKEILGDSLVGVILNDIPPTFMDELTVLIRPFLERKGLKVLGVIPKDPFMGTIKVGELAKRLGGKIISAHNKVDQPVETFLIGTMQVENFMKHFRRHRNSAVIVGGDRADVQLVALEGECPCLVLTGNLYPNDIIITRSEVLETPIIVVRDDTFSVAKKMEDILSRHKFREADKVKHVVDLLEDHIHFEQIKKELGME